MVASLDKQERANFSALFGRKASKPLYLRLYERMKKMDVYDQDHLLWGKIKSVGRLNELAKTLAEKLIFSQLQHGYGGKDKLNFVMKALHYGAWDLVPGIVEQEMERCFRAGEFHQLLGLCYLETDLLFNYGIELFPERDQPRFGIDHVWRILEQIKTLEEDNIGIRFYVVSGREEIAAPFRDRIENLSPLSLRAWKLYYSLQVKFAFGSNEPEAIRQALHDQLLFLTNGVHQHGPVELLHVLNLKAHFLALVEDYAEGWKLIEEIAATPCHNAWEKSLRTRVEGEARIGILEHSWELDRTRETQAWIAEKGEAIPLPERQELQFQLARSFFANGAWEEAGKILGELDQYPGRIFGEQTWKLHCLILANHIERENYEMIDYYLERGKASAEKSGFKFPVAYIKYFGRLGHLRKEDGLAAQLPKVGKWFLEAIEDPAELQVLWIFDLHYWIMARVEGKTLVEYRERVDLDDPEKYSGIPSSLMVGRRLVDYLYPNWKIEYI